MAYGNEKSKFHSTLNAWRLSRTDLLIVVSLTGVVALASGSVILVLPRFAEALIPAIVIGGISALVLAIRRHDVAALITREKALYQQIEALITLSRFMHLRLPLPPFREGAISPDLGLLLYQELSLLTPACIVECGAGVSTLIIGYFLQKQGRGHLISLEHDPMWATRVRKWVDHHNLQEQVTVLECPLEPIAIQGREYQWYAKTGWESCFLNNATIDFVFVDGPPEWTHQWARYPMLPLLRPFLSPQCEILVDDVDRQNDRKTVLRWVTEFDTAVEFLPCEEGAAILRFSPLVTR